MENASIYPFHEELDVIFEINNHIFGDPIYDSYSEASNEEPKYLEPIEQPSIHSTGSPRTNIIITLLIRFLQSVISCLVLLSVYHLGST